MCRKLIREKKLPHLASDVDYVLMLRKHLYKLYLANGDKRSTLIAAGVEEAGKSNAGKQAESPEDQAEPQIMEEDETDYSNKFISE